ncbi:MAG TPA: hypothetical protein VFZ61_10360, partial [Polyangiales bacterium]
RDDVLRPMFTGVKFVPRAFEIPAREEPGWRRAALVFAVSFTLVAVLVSLGRGLDAAAGFQLKHGV